MSSTSSSGSAMEEPRGPYRPPHWRPERPPSGPSVSLRQELREFHGMFRDMMNSNKQQHAALLGEIKVLKRQVYHLTTEVRKAQALVKKEQVQSRAHSASRVSTVLPLPTVVDAYRPHSHDTDPLPCVADGCVGIARPGDVYCYVHGSLGKRVEAVTTEEVEREIPIHGQNEIPIHGQNDEIPTHGQNEDMAAAWAADTREATQPQTGVIKYSRVGGKIVAVVDKHGSSVESMLRASSSTVATAAALVEYSAPLALLATGLPVTAITAAMDLGIQAVDLVELMSDTSLTAIQCFDRLATLPAILVSTTGLGIMVTSGPLMALGGLPGVGTAGVGVALVVLGALMKAPTAILRQVFGIQNDLVHGTGAAFKFGFAATKLMTLPARAVLSATGVTATLSAASLRVLASCLSSASSLTGATVAGARVLGRDEWEASLRERDVEMTAGSKILSVLEYPSVQAAQAAFAYLNRGREAGVI